MSKTLTGIIETVAGIVLEFVPGGQALGTALILGGLGTLLSHSEKPAQTETAQKQSTPPRVSGYGEGRHYMAFALYVTDKDGNAIDVGAFHDGRVDAITGYYLGDTKVTVSGGWVQSGDGNQFGENSDIVQIYTRLGAPTETAFSQVVSRIPDQWTASHRGDGVATGCVITRPVSAKGFQMVFPTGGPNNMPLSLVMRRQPVFDWRDPAQSVTDPTTWRYSENAVLHTAHYELVRDNKDWATHFAPTLAYWTAAANDADIAVPLKGVQSVMTEKADHGSGHLTLNSVNGLSVGMTIVISATGDTSLSETRTVTTISGLVIGLSSSLTNDHPTGSQVSWASSSGSPATEPRYRSCFAHKHTDEHKAVKAGLLSCFDGWMAPRSDGALVIYSGRYYEPTVTIGPDEILGFSLQDGLEEESTLNQLIVNYVSANHGYNVVDTDAWENEDDIGARGKVLSDQLANQVPSHSQARRLAKRKLAQVSAPKRGTVSTKASGRIALGQRYIRLQLIDSGTTFLDAPVEIVAPVKRNLSTGGITFNWILADPNVDEWNPATEEGEPAPVGNRIAAAPLAEPTITSAVADFSAVGDSATGVRITIIATGPDRSDITWFARWRVAGAPIWNDETYPDIDPGPSVTLVTNFVPANASVEVEVAYAIGDGRVSPFSDATTVDTATDIVAPDDATSITVASWADALNLVTERIARAPNYRWRIYADDGTTLIRTIVTSSPAVSYTSAQASVDGVARAYVATVAGVNGAGPGAEASTGVITLDAPAAVTGVVATGGATEAQIAFDIDSDPAVSGYLVATSTASGFDPLTQGSGQTFAGSPAYLQNFAAGTFYVKVAAFDAWTSRPDLLNFSGETSFVITTGGGGVGGGGGDGGGGTTCPEISMPILMANEAHDDSGVEKLAGEIVVGDWVWTRPDLGNGELGDWGAYQVEAVILAEAKVMKANIGIRPMRATPEHTMYLSGWVRMDALGTPDGSATVAKITVETAHTYCGNGILHHNIRNKNVS